MSNDPVGHPRPASVSSPPSRYDRRPRLPSVERALSACPDRWMVTLTTKRRLIPTTFSAEVSETLKRVNSKLFGTAYKRGRDGKKVQLVTMAVQELTADQALHTHLLVGVPEGSLALKANPCTTPVPDLIIQTWIDGDPQYRRREAQYARELYDLAGGRSYISKDIWDLDDFAERFDVLNTFIP